MITFTFIFLAVSWLSIASTTEALAHRRPWQLLSGERRYGLLIRQLESTRHALVLVQHLVAVVALVEATFLLSDQGMSLVAFWVVIIAALGVLLVHQGKFQQSMLSLLLRFSTSYGKYLQFIPAGLTVLEPFACRLFPDRPAFSNREELTKLVQHHHQAHNVLTPSQHKQLKTLLGIEQSVITTRMIRLSDATMVKLSDHIGPLLLSELHNSAYGAFVVYDRRRANIVGVLDQAVAVSHATIGAKVAKVMEERVVYLPRQATLQQAIQTFIETSSPISVIIDDENQPVGVLYVQDILRDLFESTED